MVGETSDPSPSPPRPGMGDAIVPHLAPHARPALRVTILAVILEGVKGGRYHVVDRWEPNPSYKALCGAMLKLTTIDLGEQWTDYHPDESSEDPETQP